jgi:hypothetical protein
MSEQIALNDWYAAIEKFFRQEHQQQFLLIGLLLTLIFAFLRLNQIRDNQGERLPPSFAAKTFFLFTHILVYGTVVLLFVLSPEILKDISSLTGGSPFEPFLQQVPLLAVAATGLLFSLPQVRELEKNYAIFLHSSQHRTIDEDRLSEHLISCAFNPSELERRQNDNYLHQFNLYITDRDNSLVKLTSAEAWRKVNTILRQVRGSENWTHQILSAGDRKEIEHLEHAHRRKTALAVSIVRILSELGSEAETSTKLTHVKELLTSTVHGDRERVSEAEDLARTIIETDTGAWQSKPIRISERQLMHYLSQIQDYFLVEYTLILQRLSRLAAKNVIRAGDLAEKRLQDLKAVGFDGLGTLENVTFDRVIWILILTWSVTFGLFSLRSAFTGTAPLPPVIISISASFALSALIGSVWGSRRSLSEKRITPWSSYLAAGLIAVAGFYIVHSLRFLFNPEQALKPLKRLLENPTFLDHLINIAPFALSPFLTTVAICRLARVRTWPAWPLLNFPDRIKDGLTLGTVVLTASLSTRFLHRYFQTAFGQIRPGPGEIWNLVLFQGAFFAVGFFIGLLIVREVRNISHSQIVAEATQAKHSSVTVQPELA